MVKAICSAARYIDLNPVRAKMIDDPATYPWSSCAALCGLRHDPLLSLHPTRALSDPARGLDSHYRALLDKATPRGELDSIRLYLQQQRAWGRDDFRAVVEAKTHRFAAANSPIRQFANQKRT